VVSIKITNNSVGTVGIWTGWSENSDSFSSRGSDFSILHSQHPAQFWGPPILLFSGY